MLTPRNTAVLTAGILPARRPPTQHESMKIAPAIVVCLMAEHILAGQTTFWFPAWLANYPGVNAETKNFAPMAQSTYTTPAKPGAVSDHYRKLFEAQNLPFQPGFDGAGTVIRAAGADYDLLITIRAQDAGTLVRVSCAAKTPEYVAVAGSDPAPALSRAKPAPVSREAHNRIVADALERHKKWMEERATHRVDHDAPAPPLEWPAWLTSSGMAKLHTERGVDQSRHDYLKGSFVTRAPMTQVYEFYKDLLETHGYPVHNAGLSTGHTMSGVMQNASGNVEGTNYPQGSPGPRTVIHVNLSRDYLNEPIKVVIKFTTYHYAASERTP